MVGFSASRVQTQANFARLTRPDFAYEVFVPAAEAKVKVPEWLNDPLWYHNRGNSTFSGESTTMGDFVGLDDLMTENPRVVQGFIEIYGQWIDEFGVDGFRIDTARHVNPEFWKTFAPAMLTQAKARGIPNFHIFGEVATDSVDVAMLSRATRVDRLADRAGFRLSCRCDRVVGQGRRFGQAGDACSAAMRCTKAARIPRCNCRRLSAITMPVALAIYVRKHAPGSERRGGPAANTAGARDDVYLAGRAGGVFG